MNKLTKDHEKKLIALRARWTESRNEMEAEQTAANAAIETAVSKINEKVADLNAIAEEANSLRDEIQSDIQSYIDDKSEKWQEGERGSAFSEWHSAWGEEVPEVEEVAVDALDVMEPIAEELLAEDSYPSEPAT